jgi:tetratricopeptide (TPR) repeat protein
MSLKYPSNSNILSLVAAFVIFAAGISSISAQSQEDGAKGQALFDSGNRLVAAGDFAGAISKFTDAMAFLPSWHLPYLNRGVANLSLAKLVEAEADADKALSLIHPGTPSGPLHAGTAYQIKGTIKQQQGDNNAALENFSIAVERVPSNAQFHNSKATAFRLLDRNADSLASYSKAIELDPKKAMFFVNRASINERLKNTEAALKDLDEALSLDKNLSSAYYTRATLRMRSKAFAEALTDFDEAIRLEPRRSIFFHARGLLHHMTKKFELAIKDHTQAIALDPNNVNGFADRAVAHGSMGNTKLAIEDLKSAVSLDNGSSALKYNLGYFLFQAGMFAESVQVATQTISLSPNWASPYILRSNGYLKLGMTAKVKADRAKAASLGPNGRPTNDKYFVFDLEVQVPEETKP